MRKKSGKTRMKPADAMVGKDEDGQDRMMHVLDEKEECERRERERNLRPIMQPKKKETDNAAV